MEIDKKKNKLENEIIYSQVDITKDFEEVYKKVTDNEKNQPPPILKEKIYPNDVKRITYCPQTESIYYYRSTDKSKTLGEKSWELFEDRGGGLEIQIILNLRNIHEIRDDYEKIIEEESRIEKLRNDQLLFSISEFVSKNGIKSYRFRNDKKIEERCKICDFNRANVKEEIILFTSDKSLVISRKTEDNQVLQKPLQNMNRTILDWYYEGLLRLKRLEQKQKFYRRNI